MREMKDSGIEWIGEIPKEWSLKKGRYLFVQRNDKGNDENLQLLSPSQKFGVIPQSLLEDLTTQTAVKLKENTDLSTLKTVHKGDFCISLRSFQGGFEYSEYEGVVSPAYQIFYKREDLVNDYYKYIFKDSSFISKMNSYTMSLRDGKNISYFDFGNTYLPLPTVDEQQQIADYLDTKCSEIDATAEDIQKEISLLEDYKKSVITEAVTKGLNPDVEMKDSGIEWIGEIPKHWDIIRIGYILSEIDRRSITGMEESLSVSQVLGVVPSSQIAVPSTASTMVGQKIVEPGELVLNKLKAHLGVCFVSNYKGLVSPDYAVYKANEKVKSKLLEYVFHTASCIWEFKKYITGVGQGLSRLYTKDLFRINVALPDMLEQQQIVDYIDSKCSEIDTLIADKKRQLDILAEYQKSLIYEYVTGKKEVPVNE